MSPETISTGPGPSSGSAVATPPAVSSGSRSRDQRMRTPKAAPSPSAAISRSPPSATLMTMSVNPARARASICQTISGLPPARSRGLGVPSVSGRMRSPRPAARIIAMVIGVPRRPLASGRVHEVGRAAFQGFQEAGQRSELAVARACAPQIAPHARHVVHVLILAVAVLQAREDAEDLELALNAHPLVIAPELREVGRYGQSGLSCALPVADRPVELALLAPFDVGVAQQRHQSGNSMSSRRSRASS